MGQTYTSKAAFEKAHPTALAVYCSDGRFTGAVEELFASMGHNRLDTLTMPGGPALLELSSAGLSALDTSREAASFLIKAHAITHVVLIAHDGCGYYRARNRLDSPEAMHRRQVADLRGAARWLKGTHASLAASMYYATIDGGRVAFDPIAENP